MKQAKVIEPLMILFDGNDSGQDITPQCEALARAHNHLIIGYSRGVSVPKFGTEFAMPQILQDDLIRRVY